MKRQQLCVRGVQNVGAVPGKVSVKGQMLHYRNTGHNLSEFKGYSQSISTAPFPINAQNWAKF